MSPSGKNEQVGATLWDHLALIMKWRKLFTVVLTFVAIGAVAYALVAQVWFKTESRILPPPANNFGLGSILPGLNMGALGAGSLLSDESNLVANVLESRTLRDAVIDTFQWMEREEYKYRISAYKRYTKLIQWELTEDGAISLEVEEESPELAQSTAQFILDYLMSEYIRISTLQAGQQRSFIEKRVDENLKAIEIAENSMMAFQKQTGVISVEDQLRTSVEAVAQLSTELYSAEVQLEVFKKTLPPSSSEVLMAQQQVNALRDKLDELNEVGENNSKDFFISINQGPEVGIQFFRLQREIETQALILQFLIPQMEQAKILEEQDKSTMIVLDQPMLPDRKSRPKRALVVIAALFVAFIVLYLIVAFIEWLRLMQIRDKEQYEKVDFVLDSAKPTRFFGKDRNDSIE
ncbi:hypothetical protein KQI63_02285 [bacterium]|nr:hypothetical protein [bacterium]